MSVDPPILVSAFVLGVAGGVHCLGMCGGIAGALAQAAPEQGPLASTFRSLLHSTGRITSYAIAGGLAGGFGEWIAGSVGALGWIRIALGLLLAAIGLQLAIAGRAFAFLERAGLGVWRRIAPLARRIGRPDRAWQVLALGFVWGWLPCGLVYSALIVAAASGSPATGALAMASFGLGTLPALLAATGLGAAIARIGRGPSARRFAGVGLICFGLWSIVGPWALSASHATHAPAPTGPVAMGAEPPSEGHPAHAHPTP